MLELSLRSIPYTLHLLKLICTAFIYLIKKGEIVILSFFNLFYSHVKFLNYPFLVSINVYRALEVCNRSQFIHFYEKSSINGMLKKWEEVSQADLSGEVGQKSRGSLSFIDSPGQDCTVLCGFARMSACVCFTTIHSVDDTTPRVSTAKQVRRRNGIAPIFLTTSSYIF